MRKLLFTLCALAALAAPAQKKIVDKVIWVVGSEPILLSEVEAMRLDAEMQGMPIENPYCVIPERLAIQKLYIHQAQIDSVNVPESNVTAYVEDRIDRFLAYYGSVENMELAAGIPIKQMRANFRKTIHDELMVQGAQSKLTESIKVTPAEVREYFRNKPEDSIPFVPTQVEVQILTIEPQPTREEVQRVEDQLREIARKVNAGESTFASQARIWSEDGSARNYGELGFKGKGELVPEFANAAWSLNSPNKVSKIVKTEYGYHIIQLIEKRGEKLNCRHILLKPRVEEKSVQAMLLRLDSIRTDILGSKFTFEEAVEAISDDKETRSNRGLMANEDPETEQVTSRFEMKALPQDVAKVVDTLKVGQISAPFRMINNTGHEVCAIVKLKNRIDGHRANITEDFQIMRNVVMNARSQEVLDKWIREKIKNTYVRIDKDWRDCNFHYDGWLH
ncbi:MAG: peptidylprolyl isomerase [Bacteroidaceae bacterium]|nr:peptidylprolyl isomerase [Bacteroidaceae bacterium]